MATEPTPTGSDIDQIGYASDEDGLKAILELLDAIGNAKTNGAAFAAVAKFRKHERIAAAKEALARWGAQPAPAASQKPLTDEQIDAVWASPKLNVPQIVNRRALARAVEAAHGIKET